MVNAKRFWSVMWNAVLLVVLWIAGLLMAGVVTRAMKEVFCVGYGC